MSDISSITQGQNEAEGGKDPSAMEHQQPKLSGAAKRKLNKQRRQQQTDEAKPGTSTGGTSTYKGGQKRNRSDGSTPTEKARPTKKSSRDPKGPVKSFKDALSDFHLAIVPGEFPEITINDEQAGLIKNHLLAKIDEMQEGGTAPRFSEVRLREGALMISCPDRDTWTWLEQTVRASSLWEGAKLSVIDAKEVPKPVRTMVWIPGPATKPDTVLHRLAIQNPGLITKNWRVVNEKQDPKGQQLIILMEEKSWKRIQEKLHGKPYLNFSRVQFKVLGVRKEGTKDNKEGQMEVDQPPTPPPPPPKPDDEGRGEAVTELP